MVKDLAGKVQTVLGLLDGGALGFTLPHEHLLIDLSVRFKLMSPSVTAGVMAEKQVSYDLIGWLRFHAFENKDNLRIEDEALSVEEATLYRIAGGRTIVDVTNWGIGQDPRALARISRATSLNIVMGTGYYTVDSGCAEELKTKTEKEIVEEIVQDITEGTEGICAGIIGEIGADSWPLDSHEIKSLKAAATAQRVTGASVNVHPGRLEESALQILDILDGAGADLGRVVMSHMDRTAYSVDSMLEMAKTGCYLEFDCFGREGYYPLRYGVFDAPNDAQRINQIMRLIEEGHLEQVLISTDMCMKKDLASFGGYGYAHILNNVIPWMRAKGLTEQSIRIITEENPRRLLTFAPPR